MPIYKADTPTKDGKVWYFKLNYTDLNGNYIQKKSKKFKTKAEATKAEAQFKIEIGSNGGNYTFQQIADELLEDAKPNMKPGGFRKLQDKCNHVTRYLGSVKIQKLTTGQYKQFYNGIRDEGYSYEHLNDILSTAKRIVKFANKRYGITTSVPDAFDNFKNPEQTPTEYNIYTPAEFEQFIKGAEDLRWKALFTTLFYTGMRIGEANALTWEDVNLENKTISITKSVDARGKEQVISTPKTRSSYRTIPISNKVATVLAELKQRWQLDEDFTETMFVFGGYRALPNNTIQTNKKAILKRSNELLLKGEQELNGSKNSALPLKEIRVHDFRHSFASMCINELKTPITTISKYLGHENPGITLSTYSHFYKDKLTELADEIDRI